MTISTIDIAWAAGFLEGEGSFMVCRHHGIYQQPRISVQQVQKEPLEKLQRLFGGKVLSVRRNNPRPNHKDVYHYGIYTSMAMQVMMTIYIFMSPERKKQIEFCIKMWTPVSKGHPVSQKLRRLAT